MLPVHRYIDKITLGWGYAGQEEDSNRIEDIELANVKVGDIQIKAAEYKSSSVKMDQCPPPTLPEIAVIGRSNVGKSSLINMLTGRKDLALVSKTPGELSLMTSCISRS